MEKSLLDRIHKAELYLLLSFDSICRKNNLTYFLDSGTALGAVRHGGFIPWDDDIDVGMPRKDYEKFIRICHDSLPGDIFLQTRNTDKNYLRHYAKLRLKGTFFPEEDVRLPLYKEKGLFIDIFPYDDISNNRLLSKIKIRVSVEIYHIIRTWRSRIISSSRVMRWIQSVIRKVPKNKIDRLDEYYGRFCQREKKNSNLMTCFFWRMTTYHSYIFEKERLFPVQDISFEGHSFSMVNDADYYLSLLYGNYMVLPPENQRESHLQGTVDFGESSF